MPQSQPLRLVLARRQRCLRLYWGLHQVLLWGHRRKGPSHHPQDGGSHQVLQSLQSRTWVQTTRHAEHCLKTLRHTEVNSPRFNRQTCSLPGQSQPSMSARINRPSERPRPQSRIPTVRRQTTRRNRSRGFWRHLQPPMPMARTTLRSKSGRNLRPSATATLHRSLRRHPARRTLATRRARSIQGRRPTSQLRVRARRQSWRKTPSSNSSRHRSPGKRGGSRCRSCHRSSN